MGCCCSKDKSAEAAAAKDDTPAPRVVRRSSSSSSPSPTRASVPAAALNKGKLPVYQDYNVRYKADIQSRTMQAQRANLYGEVAQRRAAHRSDSSTWEGGAGYGYVRSRKGVWASKGF